MPIAFDIEALRTQNNCKHYFETGLWDPIQQDISSWKAVESNFDTVHCIELRKDFVDKGNVLFKEYIDDGKYHLYQDDSTNMKKYLDSIIKRDPAARDKISIILTYPGVKAVFFIDVLFLIRLEEEKLHDQYAQVKNNIQELIKDGHDIELHLHPHWIDAKYDVKKGIWNLKDNKNYRVHRVSKNLRIKLFSDAYHLLDKIGKEVKWDFKITSFRAGGLCLQPFKDFEPLFIVVRCAIYTLDVFRPSLPANERGNIASFYCQKQYDPR